MKYYIGIDGGGTKTTVAVADENSLLFKLEGKSINFYSVGMEGARKNLAELIEKSAEKIGVAEFEAAFIGCSALDDEGDAALVEELCGGIISAKKIKIHSDVYIALESVENAQNPCVAICGTGSIAIGRLSDGSSCVAGGWGHIIGDEGSGYAIAVNALKVCCVCCDNGENTPVLQSAVKFFGVNDFRKAIDKIYSSEATKDVIAAFAAEVGHLAESGDEVALDLVRTQAVSFAETVLILLKKVKVCDSLGLYGGVFKNNKIFAKTFCEKIREQYPELECVLITTPPEDSALKLAREL